MLKKRTLRETIELIDDYKRDLAYDEYNQLLKKKEMGVEHRYTIELDELLNDFKEYYTRLTGEHLKKSMVINKAIERISIEEIMNEIGSKEVKLKNEIRDNIKISLINCKKIIEVQDKSTISRNKLINLLILKYFRDRSYDEIMRDINNEKKGGENSGDFI